MFLNLVSPVKIELAHMKDSTIYKANFANHIV